jgi:hypothetical protein
MTAIDKERRIALADSAHEYIAGFISNHDFETRLHTFLPLRAATDAGLWPIWQQLWWLCFVFGDLDTYRLRGKHRLSKKDRHTALRIVLFLRSDVRYEWAPIDFGLDHSVLWEGILSLVTLGCWGHLQRRLRESRFNEVRLTGTYDIWPFKSRFDYEATLSTACPLSVRVASS